MATPRRSIAEGRWTRSFTIAFLAMTAAVMFIALPGCYPKTAIIDVKDAKNNPKKMLITYDRNMENISATVDGEALKVTKKNLPVKLGDHSRILGAIYPGPMIVFEGSSCVYFNHHWIGYPPGTPCP